MGIDGCDRSCTAQIWDEPGDCGRARNNGLRDRPGPQCERPARANEPQDLHVQRHARYLRRQARRAVLCRLHAEPVPHRGQQFLLESGRFLELREQPAAVEDHRCDAGSDAYRDELAVRRRRPDRCRVACGLAEAPSGFRPDARALRHAVGAVSGAAAARPELVSRFDDLARRLARESRQLCRCGHPLAALWRELRERACGPDRRDRPAFGRRARQIRVCARRIHAAASIFADRRRRELAARLRRRRRIGGPTGSVATSATTVSGTHAARSRIPATGPRAASPAASSADAGVSAAAAPAPKADAQAFAAVQGSACCPAPPCSRTATSATPAQRLTRAYACARA